MPATWYRWEGTDLLLLLHVRPGASQDLIDGIHGERLKVRITTPPTGGRANTHLLEFLAGEFGVPRRRVTLLAGTSGSQKRVRIERPTRVPAGLAVAPPGTSH